MNTDPSLPHLSKGADDSLSLETPLDEALLRTLPPNPDEGPLEPTYLQLFLLKFMCPR